MKYELQNVKWNTYTNKEEDKKSVKSCFSFAKFKTYEGAEDPVYVSWTSFQIKIRSNLVPFQTYLIQIMV